MAAQKDLESQPQQSDERTPLLGTSAEAGSSQQPGDHRNDDNGATEGIQDPEQVPLITGQDGEEKKERTTSWWLWRAFWAVLAVFVLAVFIKGWTDAKDTNVSRSDNGSSKSITDSLSLSLTSKQLL